MAKLVNHYKQSLDHLTCVPLEIAITPTSSMKSFLFDYESVGFNNGCSYKFNLVLH